MPTWAPSWAPTPFDTNRKRETDAHSTPDFDANCDPDIYTDSISDFDTNTKSGIDWLAGGLAPNQSKTSKFKFHKILSKP